MGIEIGNGHQNTEIGQRDLFFRQLSCNFKIG